MEDGEANIAWNARPTGRWAASFALNLPMPALFAWMCSDDFLSPRLSIWPCAGIAAACAMLFAIGFYFAGRNNPLARKITTGGYFVAAFQLVPLIQLASGCAGFALWNSLARIFRGLSECIVQPCL